jgi:hypothetical protein
MNSYLNERSNKFLLITTAIKWCGAHFSVWEAFAAPDSMPTHETWFSCCIPVPISYPAIIWRAVESSGYGRSRAGRFSVATGDAAWGREG